MVTRVYTTILQQVLLFTTTQVDIPIISVPDKYISETCLLYEFGILISTARNDNTRKMATREYKTHAAKEPRFGHTSKRSNVTTCIYIQIKRHGSRHSTQFVSSALVQSS
jgi:hypothetical protein